MYELWRNFLVRKKWKLKEVISLQNFEIFVKDTINPLQLFIFTNVIRCSRLTLWVGYFIYFNFTHVSSIETTWLVNKGMGVLLFDVFKHLLLWKTVVLKTCRKSKFFGKKIWRNARALKSKKVQGIFGKTFILALLSSAVFRLQNHASDFC